jgi:LAO/AO transport system kinase
MRKSDSKTLRQPAADLSRLARDISAGDRATIARAITLIESSRADHRTLAQQLVQDLLPQTGQAVRVGITGAPGVGKSLTIDTLGMYLTGLGQKVAVLAVDPSSVRSGGSILGDKTRMARLSSDPNAFVRPSPAGGTLGGVAANTREAMLICEAAGYDVVLVETLGVGQSEIAVADMTDFFLVLMLPGAGDQLQGLKKGVVEIADMIAVNKADGDNIRRATAAAAEYRAALQILNPRSPNWMPPVVTYSALEGTGISELWTQVLAHRRLLSATGEFAARRREQQIKWMWALVEQRVFARLHSNPAIKAKLPKLEADVAEGTLSPGLAADQIAAALGLTGKV